MATFEHSNKATQANRQLSNEEYTVGWICAFSTEYVAARAFVDEEDQQPEYISAHDNNYTLGRLGRHKVVIAVMPDGEYGTAAATGVARDLLHSFPSVRISPMVGIGGGAPTKDHDIRLGDIVVSSPQDGHSGVLQYNFSKTIQGQKFQVTKVADQSPTLLRASVNGLKAQHERDGHEIQRSIEAGFQREKRTLKGIQSTIYPL